MLGVEAGDVSYDLALHRPFVNGPVGGSRWSCFPCQLRVFLRGVSALHGKNTVLEESNYGPCWKKIRSWVGSECRLVSYKTLFWLPRPSTLAAFLVSSNKPTCPSEPSIAILDCVMLYLLSEASPLELLDVSYDMTSEQQTLPGPVCGSVDTNNEFSAFQATATRCIEGGDGGNGCRI
ncbi:hypothetical protein F5J12DRAFT_325975 [Pisolithus orientalis]|uniref:uncharacterized protein n=1 Tax=Pisolithus orientalis TaxID=936130 RepID=UPI002224308F|nr:uncharacterized protein F5J12DRAFT_325975 [Pisolithus orientalis]KAI5981094.1 hypothetical protein F5J12DRAFT_325975 [Pisolithus orientalis]